MKLSRKFPSTSRMLRRVVFKGAYCLHLQVDRLQSTSSKKTANFVLAAVRTFNLIFMNCIHRSDQLSLLQLCPGDAILQFSGNGCFITLQTKASHQYPVEDPVHILTCCFYMTPQISSVWFSVAVRTFKMFGVNLNCRIFLEGGGLIFMASSVHCELITVHLGFIVGGEGD